MRDEFLLSYYQKRYFYFVVVSIFHNYNAPDSLLLALFLVSHLLSRLTFIYLTCSASCLCAFEESTRVSKEWSLDSPQ